LANLCFERKLKAIMQIETKRAIIIYNCGKLKYLPKAIPQEYGKNISISGLTFIFLRIK